MNKRKLSSIEILKSKTITEKYDVIESFLLSTFSVTNQGTIEMAKRNPIMATIVLEELRKIESIISKDIDSIKIEDIDVIDITTDRSSELSQFIHNFTILTNGYAYKSLCEDLKIYDKAQKLEKIFPLEKRKARLQELGKEIDKNKDMIEAISEVDEFLSKSYQAKLYDLEKEYRVIEETIYFKDISEITAETYLKCITKLRNIKERVLEKIDFLEKILGE